MAKSRRIFLVHAYQPSIAPIVSAFLNGWPEAVVLNLLDEGIYADVGADGVLSESVAKRVTNLMHHAYDSGAEGAIFTGATFGPVVDAARHNIPIPFLKADEALCEELAKQDGRIAILCTAARALPVIRAGIEAAAAKAKRPTPVVDEIHVAGAKEALIAGNAPLHDRLIAQQLQKLEGYEAIALGQISMTGARDLLPPDLAEKIYVSPESSVRMLRQLLS